MRKFLKKSSVICLCILLTFSVYSFESDREDDTEDTPDPDPELQCWNAEDDDEDGNIPAPNQDRGPYEHGDNGWDPGCVNPYWEDPNEGMIWDTHMTAVMENLPTDNGLFEDGSNSPDPMSTESIFFENTVIRGNYEENERWVDEVNVGKSFNFVDAKRTEQDLEGEESNGVDLNAYGFGYPSNDIITQAALDDWSRHGYVQEHYFDESENRIIDTPHDITGNVCGNGMHDVDDDNDLLNNNPEGHEDGYTSNEFINCKGDYGRLIEKIDMDGNSDDVEHNYGNEDLECADDDGDADASCTGHTCSCGTSNSGSGSCDGEVDFDRDCQEGTEFYENPGDIIEEYECTRDNTCAMGSGASSSNCDSYDSCSYSTCSSSGSCGSCGNQTSYSSNSRSQNCGQGHLRSFTDSPVSTTDTDSSYSVVDGGGRTNSQRMDNDPAATYTKFTAHADNSWTDNDNFCDDCDGEDPSSSTVSGSGKVWAGYDFASTVNADGPRGNGNGFIVINERAGSNSNDIDRVVGRESPDGSDSVGQNVHYGVRESGSGGEATDILGYDMIDMIDLSCSGRSEVCVKYVDFWTNGPGGHGSLGDAEWTIDPSNSNSPTKVEIENAISADSQEFTLDEGYSVCKAANRIAQKNPESMATGIDWEGSSYEDSDEIGEVLVNCDYLREDGGTREVSALPEACGDDENEHLMVMEGPSVDSEATSNWLGNELACVSWGEGEVDPHGRELDGNACVLHGEAYAEGTVMNVASPQNIDEEYEERRQSPDWQVCLDLDDSTGDWTFNYRNNDDSNDDFGGQWYDLDDDIEYNGETVNEYISSQSFTAESTSSNEAGSSANGDETWIDYYYTNNPNPQDDDYNPMGGKTGVSLIADCGPRLNGCADDTDNIRGDLATPSYHDGSDGAGTYFGFSDGDTFVEDSMDDDFHPQGESDPLGYPEPVFEGQLNLIKSISEQLDEDHPDYDIIISDHNEEWWYNTHIDVDRTVQYSYTLDNNYVIDSTGVPYPAGGIGASEAYTDHDNTGAHPHIEYQGSTRSSTVERSINKHTRAHANSLAVRADQSFEDKEGNTIRVGEAYWIDPDDILQEWDNGNIRRTDWN